MLIWLVSGVGGVRGGGTDTLHPFLSKRTLLMFHCRSLTSQTFDEVSGRFANDTRLLLVSDMRIECSSPQAVTWMLVLGLPMIVVFMLGIPAVLFWLLRTRVGPKGDPSLNARHTLGFLYATCASRRRGGHVPVHAYNPQPVVCLAPAHYPTLIASSWAPADERKYWYWEVVVMYVCYCDPSIPHVASPLPSLVGSRRMRKMALAFTVVLLSSVPHIQLVRLMLPHVVLGSRQLP